MDRRRQVIATVVSVGRHHLVTLAALGCLLFGRLLTGSYPWLATLACALDWLLVGLLARLVVRAEPADGGGLPGFVRRHHGAFVYAGFALLGFSLVALVAFAPRLLPVRIVFCLFFCLFGFGRALGGWRWKSGAAAAGVVLTTFVYPLVWSRGQLWYGVSWTAALVAGIAVFLFAFGAAAWNFRPR